MFKAVLPRRLNMEPPQWLIVAGIGLAGILLALFVNIGASEAMQPPMVQPPAVHGLEFQIAEASPPVTEPAVEPVPTDAVELDDAVASASAPGLGSAARPTLLGAAGIHCWHLVYHW
jgi:hypothetical protein